MKKDAMWIPLAPFISFFIHLGAAKQLAHTALNIILPSMLMRTELQEELTDVALVIMEADI